MKEVFVDGVHLVQFSESTAKIVLTASRLIETNEDGSAVDGYKATAARLVLTAPALASLYSRLDQIMNALEAQGVVERKTGAMTTESVQ